ncbi:MAG TPA: hypothetical protein VG497_19050 [Kribbella sp.]|nr:hypothetical protein [Kribbella sp.]
MHPKVEALVRKVQQVVAEDLEVPVPDRLPELREYDETLLLRLAESTDIPARLAPGRDAVLKAAGGRAEDDRPKLRALLTDLAADCAYSLEPQRPLPAPGHPEGRIRLGRATCQAWSELATPARLAAKVFENGRPDDIGLFPAPDETGDAVGARALVLGIIGRSEGIERDVLADLVRTGRGGTATAAARLLLAANPDYRTLPGRKQRESVVNDIAARLEEGFATPRPLSEIENVIAATIEERTLAAGWGSAALTAASVRANGQVAGIQKTLAAKGWAPLRPAEPPAGRPESVHEFVTRTKDAIRELTGAGATLWNDELAPMPENRDLAEVLVAHDTDSGTIHLDVDHAAWVLRQVTADGPDRLAADRVPAVRDAVQSVGMTLATQAVPAERTGAAGSTEFDALAFGTSHAFSEDYFNELVVRTLPADLAAQVAAAEPPFADTTWAPAVRGLAHAIDEADERDAVPSQTLRELAGQYPEGIAPAAVDVLVRESDIPGDVRAAVVQEGAQLVTQAFRLLPDQVRAWQDAGTDAGTGDLADRSYAFGHALGAEVRRLVAERETAATGRDGVQIAHDDHSFKFLAHRDPATATSTTAARPTEAPVPRPGAAPQTKPRDFGR